MIKPGDPHHLPHPAEAAQAPTKEGPHHRDPAQRRIYCREGNISNLVRRNT